MAIITIPDGMYFGGYAVSQKRFDLREMSDSTGDTRDRLVSPPRWRLRISPPSAGMSYEQADIWKSFVAQRCLWELGTGVVFHAPEVWQERNVHDLMRDFNDEVAGYQQNDRIAQLLESTELIPGPDHVRENISRCYRELVHHEIFPEKELQLVDTWLRDLSELL